ncbi:tetratricopeptide repeat protein [Blastopirellula marina]|uniref:Uncharacterized protein n=1 Tax=Blastopirellula marina TaxID=124 RepID=A0A2S8GTP2_9BACT|nr:tetratricopeptide repeat protein [Blastopirellula marina]PQO47797.1 hypothetical protein C5Y93_01775 [Blastopirellula marina]
MRYVSILAVLAIFAVGSLAQAQGLGQYQYKSRSNISVGRGGYADVVTNPSYRGNRNYSSRHGGGYHGGGSYGHRHYHSRYPTYGNYWGGGYFSGGGLSIGIGVPAYGYGFAALPPYGYGYGYPPNYSGIYPYGTYYRPGDQYLEYYLPPTQPAELNYGPQAMKQFMGLPRDFAIEPQRNQSFGVLANPLEEVPSGVPFSVAKPVQIEQPSPQAVARAAKFIEAGDNLFQQQRYHEALGRYKDAVAAAPGDAQGYLRKSLAYLATNRPEEAVAAMKLAVQQDPNIANTNITLDGLLGNNPAAKSSIIEANARRAVTDPRNADLLFCVGVLLHFDGQQAAAERMFTAAKASGGASLSYVEAFSKDDRQPVPTGKGLNL